MYLHITKLRKTEVSYTSPSPPQLLKMFLLILSSINLYLWSFLSQTKAAAPQLVSLATVFLPSNTSSRLSTDIYF